MIIHKYFFIVIVLVKFQITISSYHQKKFQNDSGRQLYQAIKENDFIKIKKLIQNKIDLNLKDTEGFTSVFWAIEFNLKEAVKLLIDNKADLNIKSNLGDTPLIYSYYNGKRDIIKLLIDSDANLHAKDKNSSTIYKLADSMQFREITELIINKISLYKIKVYKSMESNNLEEFKKYLLKVGSVCFKDKNGNNLLHRAALLKNSYIFGFVLSINKDLLSQENSKGQTPIELALGHSQNIFQLLSSL